jgi:hypothetical protein
MRRLTFAIGGSAAALLALTACGTTGTAGSAASAPSAPKVETMADLAHLVSSRTAAEHAAHITFTTGTSAGTFTGTGQVQYAGAATKLQVDVNSPIGDVDMILLGSTAYMKLPQSLVHTAKPWVRIDADGTDAISKALSAITSQEQQTADPSRAITQIGSAGTITSTGKDQVDGQPATHYVISVNTAKLMASSTVSPQMRQLLGSTGVKLPAHLSYEVWINGDNLPVRLDFTETVSTSKSAAPQKVTMTMRYTDWGAPVSITAPAANQVGPLPSW